MIEKWALKAAHRLDPENAHDLALWGLERGWVKTPRLRPSPRLTTQIAGLSLTNPLGLAAGFDKNASALSVLGKMGFGFLEVGAATPVAQPGNPKPRLFRLSEDQAIINRFGFNNQGAQIITKRLAERTRTVPVGLNLGANKESPDRSADYGRVLRMAALHVDFATVNVSSPNTEKLRDLQGRAALEKLLKGVLDTRNETAPGLPIFLKIAPDLARNEIDEIAALALELRLDGIIATNTTLDRGGLRSIHQGQQGGLSGAPLFEKSTRVLAQLYTATKGQIPLIGVGGISTADEAYAKITAGASAIQLYTALIYHGFSLISHILEGLEHALERDGFSNITEAVGTQNGAWL